MRNSRPVTVRVDGKRWRRVLTLSASGSADLHFVVETKPNGSSTVRFGDGVHGASPSKALKVLSLEAMSRDLDIVGLVGQVLVAAINKDMIHKILH